MAVEIERKFLIDKIRLTLPKTGISIRQGYLPLARDVKTVARVRVKGATGFITIKGENEGAARAEYEYEIPLQDAEEMLDTLCQRPLIEKTRYELSVGAHVWEVDVFHGDNDGLIVAEIELSETDEPFEQPAWATEEVTDDPRYYNSSLMQIPYKNW